MAKLHKLTIYICDLEETLSMDEIKTLIDERALDGCAKNCVTHFCNEQSVEKPIEWSDEININRLDCPTGEWEAYYAQP